MAAPPLRVHRLIETLPGNPAALARLANEADALFDEFGLSQEERACIREGTRAALDRIGVHPSMQFKFLFATGRSTLKMGSVRYYLDRL